MLTQPQARLPATSVTSLPWARTVLGRVQGVCWLLRRRQKTPPERGFVEVDEGTRTLDLLHGKDLARGDWSRHEPTNGSVMRVTGGCQRQGPTATDTKT